MINRYVINKQKYVQSKSFVYPPHVECPEAMSVPPLGDIVIVVF